jgi:hypothetical protein
MHGLLLLLAGATLGVEWGYRPLQSGGVEYIVQVEPNMLDELARNGQEITSEVPASLRDVRQCRITIGGQKPQRGGAAAEGGSRPYRSAQGVSISSETASGAKMSIVALDQAAIASMRSEDLVYNVRDPRRIRLRLKSTGSPRSAAGPPKTFAERSAIQPPKKSPKPPPIDPPSPFKPPSDDQPNKIRLVNEPPRGRSPLAAPEADASPDSEPADEPLSKSAKRSPPEEKHAKKQDRDPFSLLGPEGDNDPPEKNAPGGAEPPRFREDDVPPAKFPPADKFSDSATPISHGPLSGTIDDPRDRADRPSSSGREGASDPFGADPFGAPPARTEEKTQRETSSPATETMPYANFPTLPSQEPATSGDSAKAKPSPANASPYPSSVSNVSTYPYPPLNDSYPSSQEAPARLTSFQSSPTGESPKQADGPQPAKTAAAASEEAAPDKRPWWALTFSLMILFASLGGNAYLGWLNWGLRRQYASLLDMFKQQRGKGSK